LSSKNSNLVLFSHRSILSFLISTVFVTYHISIGIKLSVQFCQIFGSQFILILIKFRTKGTKVISLCLKRTTANQNIKIIIAGINATSHHVDGSNHLKIE
jgi:hypothetical protein